ncbi:hypothetical protein Sme01_41680 [Sphaerisporangium melleum]|uniref:Uncharacterized protein n=1 Tax=Sphaerisporangium melleum TaxID=321316 RepID=A0A917VN04_9ACTN|nr:hypothetical protein GCM10007964_49470 [Sphaerisporangium melleum]GII71692.1 hypothetical protein Sme01_41680 [Sphaerisporangium melleum]
MKAARGGPAARTAQACQTRGTADVRKRRQTLGKRAAWHRISEWHRGRALRVLTIAPCVNRHITPENRAKCREKCLM